MHRTLKLLKLDRLNINSLTDNLHQKDDSGAILNTRPQVSDEWSTRPSLEVVIHPGCVVLQLPLCVGSGERKDGKGERVRE